MRSPVKYKLLEECILQYGQGYSTVFTRAQFLTVLLKWLGFEPQEVDKHGEDLPLNDAIFDDFEDIGDATDFAAKRTLSQLKNRKHSTQEGLLELMGRKDTQPTGHWIANLLARP